MPQYLAYFPFLRNAHEFMSLQILDIDSVIK
jgi:hypothetical protein